MKPTLKCFLAAGLLTQIVVSPAAASTTTVSYAATGSGSSVKVSNAVYTFSDIGNGSLPPFGDVSIANSGTLTYSSGSTATAVGTLTLTFANGDKVTAAYSTANNFTLNPDQSGQVSDIASITGGTGAFANAGGALAFGFFYSPTGKTTYTLRETGVGSVTTVAAIVVTRTISHIADGSSFRTTIILLNAGGVAAHFTLDFWTETGAPLILDLGADGVTAVLQGDIAPNGARFIRTAGTAGALNKGWAELTTNTDVDGNSIFGLQTPGQGDSEAAVPLSGGGGTDVYLPFDNVPPYVTGVAFANSGHLAAAVTGTFLDTSDAPLADASMVPVPGRGHNSDVVGNFFPATRGKAGAAHFHASNSVVGLGIRANGKAFTTIEALSGVTSDSKVIAHIASGGGWKTTFLLVNTDSVAAAFTLFFLNDNGIALPLPLDTGATSTLVHDVIPPGGVRVIKAINKGTLVTGWAQLQVSTAVSGTAIFALETPGQPDSEAAVPFAEVGSHQLYMPFDYTTGYSTGIALLRVGHGQATVTVTIYDETGPQIGNPAIVVVPEHGHRSKVLSDLFPGIAGKRGMVSLSADHGIFGLGIRADGAAFTSLKVVVK